MRESHYSGPKLPKDLLDQIGSQDNSKGQKSRNSYADRKGRRKNERTAKKAIRTQPIVKHHGKTLQAGGQEISSDDDSGFAHTNARSKSGKPLKYILKPQSQESNFEEDRDGGKFHQAHIIRKHPLASKLAEDDAEIAALEKKLGVKGKKAPQGFEDDGLDLLLGGLHSGNEDAREARGKRKRSSEDEMWLLKKRQKAKGGESPSMPPLESDENNTDLDMFSGSDIVGGISDISENGEEYGSEDEFVGFESDVEEKVSPKREKENPYVPPVSDTANVAKYVPPSLRQRSGGDSDELMRLRKLAQGLVNRLSEANLLTILRDVEQLYQKYARNHVSSILIDILLGMVATRSVLQDTFIILHAGFISAIYKVIGSDFGAQLAERFVVEFDRFYTLHNQNANEAKETVNLIALFGELYNFHMIGPSLIFDYIRSFLSSVSDFNTELLLKVVKISGPQLRQDDPASLKTIVILLQSLVSDTGESNLSIRTKFMIETINNLKNNRMKTGVLASAVNSEHFTHMKKVLGTLNSRNLKATEPLRIGLKDIRNSEKRGKWWLVGASWRDESARDAAERKPVQEVEAGNFADADDLADTTNLLQLAREQGMNTEVRRAIFVAVMTATDYKDAHARLLKLNLKRAQEAEVPRVLVQCVGGEAIYNPYYALIARKMCSERRMKMAFNFALWDALKRMGETALDDDDEPDASDDEGGGELTARKVVNLAKFFGNLVAGGAMSLAALKVLNFAYLRPKTKTFLEVLLVTLILQSQKSSPSKRDEGALVSRLRTVEEAPQVARGLQYFVRRNVARSDIAGSKAEKEALKWGASVVVDFLSVIASSSVNP